MAHRRFGAGLMVGALLLGACGDGGSDGSSSAETEVDQVIDVGLVDGYEASVVVDGLVGPTQIAQGPDGDLLVAQLDGDEESATGQILRIDPGDPGDRTVLFDGLRKPTGVLLAGDEVWVMEERTLSRGPVAGGELTPVLTELPYNGRSEGTLGLTPAGEVLYDTSGTVKGAGAQAGSATLWSIDPTIDQPEPTAIATGFKHAYATTYDDEGTLWSTEMSDGLYGGEPAPDELVPVEMDDDFGWPDCIGDGTPVAVYGATEELCAQKPRSHALFDPGATPTSVALAPWDPDTLLVALWVEGRVVAVPRTGGPENPADEALTGTTLLDGIERPQHLLAVGDRLLVSDHATGRIVAITQVQR